MSVIFWLAAILFVFGLALLLSPQKVLSAGSTLNRAVSTRSFFKMMDEPRYKESVIYRHHVGAGTAIVVATVIIIYMLAFYTPVETIIEGIRRVAANDPFYSWLLEIGYYLILAFNVLALIIGLIVIVRPSLLKGVERWGNRWIETGDQLERLDEEHQIPENILPGKPRLFGLGVCLGTAYIMYNAWQFVF